MRITAAILLFGGLLLPACVDDTGVDGAGSAVGTLRQRVAELQDEVDDLREEVELRGLQIDELLHAVETLKARPVAAVDEDPDGPAPAAEPLPADAPEFASFLRTEEGKKLIQEGLQSAEERRVQERRSRILEARVRRMKEELSLNDYEAEQIQAVIQKYSPQLREVWSSYRQQRLGGDAEDPGLLAEATRQATEIRGRMNEEAKALLSPEQFEKFDTMTKRMAGRGVGVASMPRRRGR